VDSDKPMSNRYFVQIIEEMPVRIFYFTHRTCSLFKKVMIMLVVYK
jgi:hypothetical protein